MLDLTFIGLGAFLLLGIITAMVVATFLLNRRVGFAVLLGIVVLILLAAALLLLGGVTTWLGLLGVISCSFFLALAGLVCTLVTRALSPPRRRPVPERRTDIAGHGRQTPPTRAGHCPACGAALPTDAPEGLCPRCLLQSGLANPSPVLSPRSTTPHPGTFVAPAPADLAPYFPQLEILELVGQGGMGAVYKARQTKLDRLVALKILPPEWGSDPAFAERFTREGRALARLNHPHIVAVHDFGETGGLFYLLMEYVDGGNLRQLLQAGPLPPEQALAVIPQLCDALEYAHEEGIVHRDVKPENILLDRKGRVKIADFGLAKLLGRPRAEFTLTGSQQVMGTLDYMAPEQRSRPQEIDHRADIYALGVVFYEMLTGDLPLGRFAPPSRRSGVDARIDEVLFRALETDPDLRYQSAGALKSDIQSGGEAGAVAAARAELIHRPSPLASKELRKRVMAPAIGLIVVGVLQCVFLAAVAIAPIVHFARILCFDEHGMPFLLERWGGYQVECLMTLGWCLLGMVTSAAVIQGALRMMWLRSYRLAVFSGVLVLLPCSPMFLGGLPMGSWALVVLRDPEVEAAFAAEARRLATFRKRRLPAQPTGPVRRRVRSFFRSVRSLMLYSSPKQTGSLPAASRFSGQAATGENGSSGEPILTTPGGVAAERSDGGVPVGAAREGGRRNGHVWALVLVLLVLPFGSVLLCAGAFGWVYWRADLPPATAPATLTPNSTAKAASAGSGQGIPIRVEELDKAPVRVSPNWREGIVGPSPEMVRYLGLPDYELARLTQELRSAYQDYLAAEAKHAQRSLDEQGHLHVTVAPFANERDELETNAWRTFSFTQDVKSRARGCLNLCVPLGCRPETRDPGALFPRDTGWTAEIWREGTQFHWKVTNRGGQQKPDLASGSGAELPLPWQRFWRGGQP